MNKWFLLSFYFLLAGCSNVNLINHYTDGDPLDNSKAVIVGTYLKGLLYSRMI